LTRFTQKPLQNEPAKGFWLKKNSAHLISYNKNKITILMDNDKRQSSLDNLQEKKAIKRHHLPHYLLVFNRVTNKPLGSIVNISNQGMILVSKHKLLTHAQFNLQMKVPAPKGIKKINFEAMSHWCKQEVSPGHYDTGFSFPNPPEELKALIRALSEYFTFSPDAPANSLEKRPQG